MSRPSLAFLNRVSFKSLRPEGNEIVQSPEFEMLKILG